MAIFSGIMTIISVIKELIKLIKVFMDMAEKNKIADAERRRQELEKAVEDMKKANTPEEIADAQKRIVAARPK